MNYSVGIKGGGADTVGLGPFMRVSRPAMQRWHRALPVMEFTERMAIRATRSASRLALIKTMISHLAFILTGFPFDSANKSSISVDKYFCIFSRLSFPAYMQSKCLNQGERHRGPYARNGMLK